MKEIHNFNRTVKTLKQQGIDCFEFKKIAQAFFAYAHPDLTDSFFICECHSCGRVYASKFDEQLCSERCETEYEQRPVRNAPVYQP